MATIGDKVTIRYKSGTVIMERPARVVRLTKTLIGVIEDGKKTERTFKRGFETVPGGGVSHSTQLIGQDGFTYR